MTYKIVVTAALIILAMVFYKYIQKQRPPETVVNIPELSQTDTSGVYVDANTSVAHIQEKQPDGTVQTHSTFVPSESNYNITTSTQTGKTDIQFTNKGFCLVPTISATYTDQIVLSAGARLAYWNEWGIGCHLSSDASLGVFIDYRLYVAKLKNVSIFLSFVPVNNHGDTFRGGISVYLN